jgi:hypothetical protein
MLLFLLNSPCLTVTVADWLGYINHNIQTRLLAATTFVALWTYVAYDLSQPYDCLYEYRAVRAWQEGLQRINKFPFLANLDPVHTACCVCVCVYTGRI